MVPYLNDMPTSDYACPAPSLPVGIVPPVVGNEAGEAGEHEEDNVGDQPPDAGQPESEVGVGVVPDEVEEAGVDPGQEVRDLKVEATSLKHLMTHFPKNPHCTACQRAKMTTTPARKTYRPGPEPQAFGENVTADHVVINEHDEGVGGERAALVVLDRGTGWIDCYPVADKSADEATRALGDFVGPKINVANF